MVTPPTLQQRADDAVRVSGVSKKFRSKHGIVEALTDVDFCVAPGEVVALVGPSGCGKSTLLRLISGLDLDCEGQVEVAGRRVVTPVTELGFAFQQPLLLDWLNVIDNVLLQVQCRPGDKNAARDYAHELLRMVGLDQFAHRRVYELSGGMQQRAALCRALVHRPSLLLMDEPFGALDALTRDQISVDIQPILAKAAASVVLVTHSIAEAVLLADRIVVMSPRPGRIVESLSVDLPRPRALDLRRDPRYVELVARVTETFESLGVLS
jgi:NitT/TauT family transport system ATP-binding protein